jgi:hypothetical protein
MDSSGTGSDISEQVLADLLHKLITESTNVQASFMSSTGRVEFTMRGFLRLNSDGTFKVGETDGNATDPVLKFDPFLAVIRKYGDERSMGDDKGESPFGVRFSSVLTLRFDGGAILGLWAIRQE